MRFSTTAILAATLFSLSAPGAPAAEKLQKGKMPPAPAAPKQGIKTPGIQIPFASVTSEATIPAPGKPAWIFLLADAPPGGGSGRGGGGARGGGRGGGSGAPGTPDAAVAPAPGASAGVPAGRGGPAAGAAAGGATGTIYIANGDKLDKVATRDNKIGEPLAGLKKPCGGLVSAFGSLWVPTCGDGALQRIEARTGKITATIPSGAADTKGSIVATTDSIWLLTDNRETLSRIDPNQNAVIGELRLPPGCNNMLFAETAIWLTCPEQNKILKINPATNIVDKRIDVSGRPISIVNGETSIWVLCGKDGKIDRIDPKTDKVTKTIDLMTPNMDGAMAFGEGFLWITGGGFPITRVDATAETVAQQFWGEGGGGGIITSAGAIWLSNPNAGTVTRIDPKLLLATLAE